MAPSTPPPPRSDVFAALTIASTASVVMSATMTSSRAGPTSTLRIGWDMRQFYHKAALDRMRRAAFAVEHEHKPTNERGAKHEALGHFNGIGNRRVRPRCGR